MTGKRILAKIWVYNQTKIKGFLGYCFLVCLVSPVGIAIMLTPARPFAIALLLGILAWTVSCDHREDTSRVKAIKKRLHNKGVAPKS